MGMQAGRTGSRGNLLGWPTPLILPLALLGASRLFPPIDRDPGAGPKPGALPFVIDEHVIVRAMSPPRPTGSAMESMMMGRLPSFEDAPEYRAAAVQGRAEAEAEPREARATLYTRGPGVTTDRIDRGTGLPLRWVGGCTIEARTEGLVAGHNARIEEFIRDHGPPASPAGPPPPGSHPAPSPDPTVAGPVERPRAAP